MPVGEHARVTGNNSSAASGGRLRQFELRLPSDSPEQLAPLDRLVHLQAGVMGLKPEQARRQAVLVLPPNTTQLPT